MLFSANKIAFHIKKGNRGGGGLLFVEFLRVMGWIDG